jgi:hypothetical protein
MPRKTVPKSPHDFKKIAEDLVLQWQEILRLQDWDIEVEIIKGWESPGNYATICGQSLQKRATLKLVDPNDWHPEDATPKEVAATIVHELLHLHFRQAGYDYEEDKEEPVVHALEKAFAFFIEV